MTHLDLNADLGEGLGGDAEMLAIVSSASIACGGHAGDPASMRAALRAAGRHGVTAGYHPGFLDPENFGRTRLTLAPATLERQLRTQLEALAAIAAEEAVPLRYVKLHGALANMAAEDEALARHCFSAVRAFDPGLAILALDATAQVSAADALGLAIIAEAYADRAYRADGLLVPRAEPGAVLHDHAAIASRALRLAESGELVASDGTILRTRARSLCIHGDNPEAIAIARAVRAALTGAGIAIRAAL
ncbi:LamB/YcsF family protein [Arsenicitalea aurantiaca]|uniref:LamB/YcsF family protein n=1 Tax=Arsenicitalea aurantiaca TaxID=1783274 RepID=A0A433XFH5_9HYPH|nr:5-oxoprolinase subunit PxpA [Arsenicitalea aurantiaca]RUT32867.1 LamB/YcsF family protein [Arsenicitalea aurantiaca]